MDRAAWQATVHAIRESDMTEQLTLILLDQATDLLCRDTHPTPRYT